MHFHDKIPSLVAAASCSTFPNFFTERCTSLLCHGRNFAQVGRRACKASDYCKNNIRKTRFVQGHQDALTTAVSFS